MTRRTFSGSLLAAATAPRQIRREVFLRSPRLGVAVIASAAYYTRTTGGDMMSIEQRFSRSDTVDEAFYRYSSDYGKTWTAPVARKVSERRPEGMWRRVPRGGCADPSGVFIEFWVEGVLPSDDPLEGMRQWTVWYGISTDGGRTLKRAAQIIHRGPEYSARHPMPGITIGKNCYMIGEITEYPLYLDDKSFLFPIVVTPVGPDGEYYNPTGGYTYTDAAILRGSWVGDDLEWELQGRVAGDPKLATRGMDEPTLGQLKDGRIVMVMRGSNDRNHDLPSRRWISFSTDNGRTFGKPEPWAYTDGTLFYSPSACSQLVSHSSGRLFWLGNITPENPKGNRPRYPFVIGEVDRSSGLLIRQSVRIVDDLQPGEDPILSLSSFFAREDRQTGDIDVHLSRIFSSKDKEWKGDSYLFHIPV